MRKVLFGIAILSVFALFTGCGKKETAYYPRYHSAALYAQGQPNSPVSQYLNWGTKLIASGKTATNAVVNVQPDGSVKTNKEYIFAEVKVPQLNTTGWVDLGTIVTNAVTRGVILSSSAIVRKTPSMLDNQSKSVNPPMLAYVTEVLKNDSGSWAILELYNASESYRLPGSPASEWISSPRYIDMTSISTNQQDVDIVIALQVSIKKFSAITNTFNASTNANRADKYAAELKLVVDNLQQILTKNSQASTAVYGFAQEFLNYVNPSAAASIAPADEETEGESLEGEASDGTSQDNSGGNEEL